MKAILKNTSAVALPVVLWTSSDKPSQHGTGMLAAGSSLSIDDLDVVRVGVGDVPTYRESLEEFLKQASEIMKALIEHLLAQPKETGASATISIQVENWGDYDIRAIAGANVDELLVKPAQLMEVVAPGPTVGAGKWIELRQLGV